MDKKVLIIGLDGATFKIIYPMMKQGKLKDIRKIIENGTRGNLKSTIPPISPVAWTSLATEVKPRKHKVFGFTTQTKNGLGKREYIYIDRDFIGTLPFWDILSQYNKKICLIGFPFTYPSSPVNGAMVSGFGTPDNNCNFSYPKSIEQTPRKNVSMLQNLG